jgi:hypothetical protein
VNDISVNDAILVKALIDGTMTGPDGDKVTLTVKGFVGANIVAARVALSTLTYPITQSDAKEIIAFLKEAETALNMLEDKETDV